MDKKELIETAKKMKSAPSCCPDAQKAVGAWIEAVGTAQEKEAAQKMIAELKEDVTTIDGLIGFAQGPAKEVMGEEKANSLLKEAQEAKAKGEKYCTCPACQAGKVLLEHQADILG